MSSRSKTDDTLTKRLYPFVQMKYSFFPRTASSNILVISISHHNPFFSIVAAFFFLLLEK